MRNFLVFLVVGSILVFSVVFITRYTTISQMPNPVLNPGPGPADNNGTTANNGDTTDNNTGSSDGSNEDSTEGSTGQNTGSNFEAPPLDYSNEKLVRGDGITIDMTTQEIVIEGSICRQQGLLEYLAIVPKSGKDHESLLYFECNPIHLNLALIMLGMVSTPQVQYEGAAMELKGDKVVIDVTFEFKGKKVTWRAEDLIINRITQKPMPRVGFVYTGSTFYEVPKKGPDGKWIKVDVYAALATGIMGAIYHHPAAILDNPLLWGADDTIWFARYDELPPRFTKASITIRRPSSGDLVPVPKELTLPK